MHMQNTYRASRTCTTAQTCANNFAQSVAACTRTYACAKACTHAQANGYLYSHTYKHVRNDTPHTSTHKKIYVHKCTHTHARPARTNPPPMHAAFQSAPSLHKLGHRVRTTIARQRPLLTPTASASSFSSFDISRLPHGANGASLAGTNSQNSARYLFTT